MQVLFYMWNSYMFFGVEDGFQKLGISYDKLFIPTDENGRNEENEGKLRAMLSAKTYDLVFSINFITGVSVVCEEMGVRYVSWVYDSPLPFYEEDILKNSCNEIHMFDRGMVEIYKKRGLPIQHTLLAADTATFGKRQVNPSYQKNISFVGNMYNKKFLEYIDDYNTYSQGFFYGLIRAQRLVPDGSIIEPVIHSKFQDRFDNFQDETAFWCFLAYQATYEDRVAILETLAQYFPDVNLYSTKDPKLPQVIFHDEIGYYDDMSTLFYNSKINLHINQYAIQTGVGLRFFDILASGGFAMTSAKPEVFDFMHPGEDCEVYYSIGDLVSKCDFYLKHDDIREAIARRGYERALTDLSFERQLAQILGLSQ